MSFIAFRGGRMGEFVESTRFPKRLPSGSWFKDHLTDEWYFMRSKHLAPVRVPVESLPKTIRVRCLLLSIQP